MMKTALVLEQFRYLRGGAERSSYEMACALSELGVEVTILAGRFDLSGIASAEGVPFQMRELPIRGNRVRRWYELVETIDSIRRSKEYDIIHSMAPLAAAHVYQPRGGSLRYSMQRHIRSYSNSVVRVLKKVSAGLNIARKIRMDSEYSLCRDRNGPVVAVLSEYVHRQFRMLYGLPPERVRLIRNGIDVALVRNDAVREQGRRLRRLYDPDGDTSLLLFAAENPRLKGLALLLEAIRLLDKEVGLKHRCILFVVSGQGGSDYLPHVQKLGIDRQVCFLNKTGEMAALVNMCDMVVLPSYNDACSRLVMEALAAGKPAITSNFNGAGEFLDDGRYGSIVPDMGNVGAWADAIKDLCNPDRRRQINQVLENTGMAEQLSMKRHCRELLELYEDILVGHT